MCFLSHGQTAEACEDGNCKSLENIAFFGGCPRFCFSANKAKPKILKNRWLFEAGGRGKGVAQIKDIPDSFVVNDGVEVGIGNKIPLWLFGFLY